MWRRVMALEKFIFIFVVMCVFPVFAQADFVPDWRKLEGATYQEWSFDTESANPVLPEDELNNYGQPTADITVTDFGSGWLDVLLGLGTQTGVWDIGPAGSIVIDLPTQVTPPGNYTEVWIQVVYFEDPGFFLAPDISMLAGQLQADQTQTQLVESTIPSGNWILQKSVWYLDLTTPIEQITISADLNYSSIIDKVIIDARVVPEPATVGLLLFGSVIMLAKKRR
ncbi:MAG: PEP-CTERM sorting domain-containing protein [Planctomycetota bacterium]